MKVEIEEDDGSAKLSVNGVHVVYLPHVWARGAKYDMQYLIKSRLVAALAPDVAALKAKIARLEDALERTAEERDALYDALVLLVTAHGEAADAASAHLKDHGIR